MDDNRIAELGHHLRVAAGLPTQSLRQPLNVVIDYTNWRGERRKRVIFPMTLTYGLSEFHPGNQWLLLARDCEDGKLKEFAMKDIHSWEPQT